MFPSNPWIQYRLERVDLSHNSLPILTFDITFGTRKLKYLNLSNNGISDIRKYVIGNITGLEVLDLSNNHLTNLNDPDAPFNLPENITELILRDNQIFKIDYEKIAMLKHLRDIDLRNNQLSKLNKSMIDAIKRGVSVQFSGNPLTCNCEIQPLKQILLGQEFPPEKYSHLTCSQPQQLSGMYLDDVEDRQLICNSEERTNIEEFNHEYEVLPDIRFRDILL
jgi:Leucine-rich repeat (LRR) protein